MNVIETILPGVLILEPKVFGDERGFFMESWNAKTFADAIGASVAFVQDNHSRSAQNVLRGIHYQLEKPQGKLVRVTRGEVLDVAVDLRKSSPMFGRWVAVSLNEANRLQLWIPPGFGHAFLVQSETADFLYKTTEYWYPKLDRSLVWNDPEVGVDWNLNGSEPVLAAKDAAAPRLASADVYP